MRRTSFTFTLCLLSIVVFHSVGEANTVNLFNNSPYTLRAVIYDANENMLSEMTLNSQDGTQWSDNEEEFSSGMNPSSSQTPYSVNWYCMKGSPYGICNDVSPGQSVYAQSCMGSQECEQSN